MKSIHYSTVILLAFGVCGFLWDQKDPPSNNRQATKAISQ